MVIGYYVHHVGAGHRVRAQAIAAALAKQGHDVTFLGTDVQDLAEAGHRVIDLPTDATAGGSDLDGDGAFHWIPLRHNGYRARMEALASWLSSFQPQVFVVDVSVEVSVLVRLLGVPTVVIAQPGDRRDDPHLLAYRTATAIVAPWPAQARPCPALEDFRAKVTCVGGISRYAADTRSRTVTDSVAAQVDPFSPLKGLLLMGGNAGTPPDLIAREIASSSPDLTWKAVGGSGEWVSDVSPLLREADVVVTHAGQNSIADVAACDARALIVPQERPHEEQQHLAVELARLDLAQVWSPSLSPRANLELALDRRPDWSCWETSGAAARAADVVVAVGR